MANEFEDLVNAAAAEDPTYLAEVVPNPRIFFNNPVAILLSWTLLFGTIFYVQLHPLPNNFDAGPRSVKTRLSVAMYHVAHKVESYRNSTGHLPDYLDPSWSKSALINYERTEAGYLLVGKLGEFELAYKDGDDPEPLIHIGGNNGR